MLKVGELYIDTVFRIRIMRGQQDKDPAPRCKKAEINSVPTSIRSEDWAKLVWIF